jgi:hypothetical protein
MMGIVQMTRSAVVALSLMALVDQGVWPTLGQVLAEHGVPSAGIPDTDRRITSYAVADSPEWFGIGYYWDQGDERLPALVRVRTFDKRERRWREAELGAVGSITAIRRLDGWVYVTGHSSPSRAPTLVLTEDLRLQKELDGWIMLGLPGGAAIYHRGMVHFAPVHPGSLALYDPATGRDVQVYPPEDVAREDLERLVDRRISDVRPGPEAGTIVFRVVEQRSRWKDRTMTEPAGAAQRLVVMCAIAGTPRCVEEKQR